MSFVVDGPQVLTDSVLMFRVLEDTPGASDEWEISLDEFFNFGHVVLVQASVLAGTGTVQPELGELPGWTIDGRGHIAQAEAAAAHVRMGEYKNFLVRQGSLFGRSKPAGGTPTSVETLVYVKAGAAL